MTDRPIIFSAPMVRALLDGRKTQTRRLATSPLRRCEVGDRLYVREAWSTQARHDHMLPRDLFVGTAAYLHASKDWLFDGHRLHESMRDHPGAQIGKYRPGMHMPRWASRLTLIVEAVKVERVQDISEVDAIAEGCARLAHDGEGHFFEHTDGTFRCGFAGLWDHLHGADAWDDNPFVVALTFRVEHRNIDAPDGGEG